MSFLFQCLTLILLEIFPFLEEEEDAFHPDTGELILGDIMIAVERMREQAETYGHGEVREYAFLIAHSMLHLMDRNERGSQMKRCWWKRKTGRNLRRIEFSVNKKVLNQRLNK